MALFKVQCHYVSSMVDQAVGNCSQIFKLSVGLVVKHFNHVSRIWRLSSFGADA